MRFTGRPRYGAGLERPRRLRDEQLDIRVSRDPDARLSQFRWHPDLEPQEAWHPRNFCSSEN